MAAHLMRTAPGIRASMRPLAFLAAPMLIGQAGQVLLQITDTIMVGRLGAVELAATALAGNFVMFAMYIAYGAIGAVSPRVAQAFGAKHETAVGDTARAGMVLATCVGVLIAIGMCAVVPVLDRLGQPPEVVVATRPYLVILACSMPAALFCLVLGQIAEALNQPWPVVWFMAAALVLNTVLNLLLIFGMFGFPELGLLGAAWATLIARCFQAIAMLIWVARSRIMKTFGIFARRVDLDLFNRLWRDGLPIAGQDVLEGGSFAVGTLMMGWVGTTAMAANQVALSIASLAWMFPIALSMAASVRVAQDLGSGSKAAARQSGIAAIILGTSLMGVCAVFYIAAGRWLAGLFTTDPEVAAMAGFLVVIAGIYQVSDAIQSISLGSLRGLLDNKVPMIANAICYWVLSIPTVYFLAFTLEMGAAGMWFGYLPWMVLTGLFFFWRFLRKTR